MLKPKLFTTLKGYTLSQFTSDLTAGLIVGIIATTFYNTIVERVNSLVLDLEVVSNDIIDILEEMAKNKNIDFDELESEN